MKFLVSGGSGFIGGALVRHLVGETTHEVVNVDCLTYAGNQDSLRSVRDNDRYRFEKADICEADRIRDIFDEHQPDLVVHLAAESHVDRSIDGPSVFVHTNVVGTQVLLDAALDYWRASTPERKKRFRFLHVSTDEVYGDLGPGDGLFREDTPYAPSSPYSATKAASDHLVRAWQRTFGLPTVVTNCSNNYGPYQFPEKLIPHIILNAIAGKPLPVYGDGSQVRDWIHVEDHARALVRVATEGEMGQTYNVGGRAERRNIEVVRAVCALLDERAPDRLAPGTASYDELIQFVTDRPGHDQRYAIDSSKIEAALRWRPARTFESGLRETVEWYLANEWWWSRVVSGDYRLERIGVGGDPS